MSRAFLILPSLGAQSAFTPVRDITARIGLALAQDTFTRANTTGNAASGNVNGWGQPSDFAVNGDTWSNAGGATLTYSLLGNEGKITGAAGTPTTIEYMLLGSQSPGNVEGRVRFSVSATTDSAGLLLRYTNANNHYRARYNNGQLLIQSQVGGSSTNLATLSFTVTAGSFYWIRARAVGTMLLAKIWADGGAEPAWTAPANAISAVDTTFASGQIGLVSKLNAQADVVQFDSLVFTGVPAPYHDLASRVRIAVLSLQDLAIRARVAAVRPADLLSRVRLSVPLARDLASRVRLCLQPTPHAQDLACRILLAPSLPASPSLATPSGPAMAGGGVVPLWAVGKYASSGGIPLATQPYLAGAPIATSGSVPAGTLFSLFFASADAATQALFATAGAVLPAFTFLTSEGATLTGPVTVVSTTLLSGNTLVVTLQTTATLTVNRWVVVTQFL